MLERRDLPAQVVLGSLLLDGPLTLNGSIYSACGPVNIGFNPTGTESYLPLTVWNGNLSFTSGGSNFTFAGSISAIEQSANLVVGLATTAQTYSVSALTGSGVAVSGGSTINVVGGNFQSNTLALADPAGGDSTNSYVSLQGSLGFSQLFGLSIPVSGTNSVQVNPSATAPGLTLVAATTTSAFQAFGANFGPVSLSAGYSSSANNFQISGSVGFSTSSGDFSVSGGLGTPSSPGLLISNSGSVTALSVTMSSNISTYGLNINANALTLNYVPAASNQYQILSGSISAATNAGDFSFSGQFGSGNQPGVVISNGSLLSLYTTLNGEVTASGLGLTASNDVLQFSAANGSTPALFEILTGNVTVGSNSTDVLFQGVFGSTTGQGVVLQNGQLTALDITVNSNMNVSGLNLAANGVEFIYNSAGNQFEIATGNVSVSGSGFYFDGLFGSGTGANATAGLMMVGSTLTGLDITVSSLINLDGMTLTVDNLQFIYENNANSIYNGDFLINTGNVSIATSAKDTFFEAQFGNTALSLPGLVIHNGSLSSLYTVITSTINAQDLILNANGLVFQYQGSTQIFEIASGSVSISSGDIQFASASFGISGNPGLAIDNGVLSELNITINSSMNVQGLSLTISSMQFIYYAVAGQTYGNFEIAAGGSVSLSTGSSAAPLSFSGLFGTSSNGTTLPGLVINNGNLQSFYIGINSNITAAGLVISTTNLTFSYNAAGNSFQIPSGSISVVSSSGDFNFNGTFGGTLSNGTSVPGLVVSNGVLNELNTTVTSKLVASGLTFELKNLDFYYNSSGNQFEIDSGNISFNTNEGFSFSANFGLPNPSNTSQMLPGLVVSNGIFTEFNAALNASFTVAGLIINVDDMAMVYNSSQFEMYGTVTVNTTDVNFQGIIGQPTASPPVYGLVIQNGDLESLAITINSNVTFSDLSMQAQGLSFNYNSSPESFSLYGNVSISIDGVNLTGFLGNATLPGLSLVNGQLETLNLGVTTDFTLFDLNCNVDDLTFIYEASSSTYIMYGALSVSIADGESTQKIAATMGSESDPGLTIVGSTVTEINMSLNADFTVDGFSFDVVDAGIMYQASDDNYQIYGTFTLSDVFSASVQLGTQTNPGIIVSNSVFIVNEIAISLDNVPIGAFTLNYVDISYDSTGDEWQGAAAVTFPTGWQIGASMTFINGNLDDISLFYSAGKSQGIAIPDTGIFVTYIEASLQNLEDPVSIIVSGSIVGDFGGQISIGGVTCRIFTAMGSFSADGQQLSISGDYYMGAYQTNDSNPLTGWTGILGSGSASVDLNWAAGTYTANMSCSLYEGIFVISAELAFNDEGDLGLIATATVEVPSEVPFIGGTKLGSMSFAFIYTASTNSGLVGAWTTVNCGINITTGFQYNFSSGSSGSFELIGAGGVNSIENDFNSITSSDNSVPPTYVYTYSVTVPSGSGSNGISVQAIWPSNNGTQTIGVSGPNNNGTYYQYTTSASSIPDTIEFLTAYTTPTTQSVLYNGSPTNTSVLLTPGTYNFQVQSSYEFASTSCITWTNQLYYESPNITVNSVPSKALAFVPSLTGYAAGALASNTTVTLYIDTDNSGYNGKSSGTFPYSVSNTTTGGTLLNVPSLDLSSYAPGVPLYIYAVINDGTNTAVTSTYSAAVIPVPNLIGNVIDQFGNPLSGIRMFLDLNNNQMYDSPVYASNGTMTFAGEPTVTTNANGSYYFNGLESYSSSDIGYPNFRVMALMPSPSFTPITPANATISFTLNDTANSSNSTIESVVANFTINRLASISGSIYSDLLQTGVYNANDPALSGATVYLDVNNNGQYDTGEMTCETGPSGTFGFYDLTPGNYTMGIITSSTSGNTTIQNYLVTQPSCGTYSVPVTSDSQQLVNYTFGVISLATVSGTTYSQPTSSSIASPLANAIVQISTPNLSVSVPNYSNFTNASKLQLNSATITSGGSLSLVSSSSSGSTSSAWYSKAVPLTGGFESVFQWTLTDTANASGGMAFVLQNTGTSAKGSNPYGYSGLTKSLGVIFNAAGNQILIESGGNTSTSSALASLTGNQLGFNLASGNSYTARITFKPLNSSGLGNLSVYLSGDSSGGMTPAMTTQVNLTSILSLGSSGSAYLGFTGGTSGTGLSAQVSSWSVTSLNTITTTSDSSGNYNFTGLMPLANYTISQLPPDNYVQASPLQMLGIYSQTKLSATPANVSASVTGDFNSDGIPDIAYATSLNTGKQYQISYAYGKGNGTFGSLNNVNLPVPSTAPVLAVPTDGSLSFDAFLASGTFGSTARDSICYSAVAANGGVVMVIYDIDTNAILNLVQVGNSTSSYAPTGVTVGAGYVGTINNIATGDLNNDGYSDLAVSTYGGIFTLVNMQNIQNAKNWVVNPTGMANPLGTPSLLYANGTSGNTNGVSFNAGVAIADFNGDGSQDLASIGVQYIPEVSEGKTTTISWSSMTVATTLQLAYGQQATGVNYNAQSQILFQIYSESNIDQYFSSSSSQPTFALPFGITASDVTGDGVPDIALNGYMDNLMPAAFLIQQLYGNLTTVGSIEIPNGKPFNIVNTFGDDVVIPGSTTLPAQIIAGDFNLDGYIDVAAIDPNFGQLMLLTTNSAPLSSAQTTTMVELTGGALATFASADFDLNGYPDFVVPGANNGTTSQTAPEMIINGTINVGTISYMPQNGQSLAGQNFINIDYSSIENPVVVASSSTKHAAVLSASIKPASRKLKLGGRVFIDLSQDGRVNVGEAGLGGVKIYLDENNNGQFDPGIDDLTVTNNLGYFTFDDVQPGLSCPVRFINLPSVYESASVEIMLPETSSTGVVLRNIPVNLSWYNPQPALVSVAPLTPFRIELSSTMLSRTLGFQPIYRLTGNVPAGMSIDPQKGTLSWTAPANAINQSFKIEVEVVNPANRSALLAQKTTLTIQVRSLSDADIYVRNLFSRLFNRLPLPEEGAIWAERLKNGWKTTDVVNGLYRTDERYLQLTRQVYQNILNRVPTSAENTNSLELFRKGGNSDQLSRELLSGAEFSQLHQSNTDYLNAVYRLLLLNPPSKVAYISQLTWLNAGGSRTVLINRLYRSLAVTTSRAIQLAGWYNGIDASQKSIRQWASALATGTLNTDTLTILILGSDSYTKATKALSIHDQTDQNRQAFRQYNELSFLTFTLTGKDAERATIDQLQHRIYKGQTWKKLTNEIYDSQAAMNYRINSQYQNLLHRSATEAELARLRKTLPVNNQIESLQIQILSGNEYRSQFSSNRNYVSGVYLVLTGKDPDSSIAAYYATRLTQGMKSVSFVRQVAASEAGIAGQINRNYLEILGRSASDSEIVQFRQLFGKSAPQDSAVSIQLLGTDEFRQKQRPALLLPVFQTK